MRICTFTLSNFQTQCLSRFIYKFLHKGINQRVMGLKSCYQIYGWKYENNRKRFNVKFIANQSNDTKYYIFYLPSDLKRYKVKVRRDNKFSSKQDIELQLIEKEVTKRSSFWTKVNFAIKYETNVSRPAEKTRSLKGSTLLKHEL